MFFFDFLVLNKIKTIDKYYKEKLLTNKNLVVQIH